MNCPNCGREMLCGTLHTHTRPYWTQQELRFFKRPTDTIYLTPHGSDDTSMFMDPYPEFSDTWLCKACGLVTFPCKLIEKRKK